MASDASHHHASSPSATSPHGNAATTLLTLPEELVERILDFLPPKDLVTAAQTCTQFARIAEGLFRKRLARRGIRMPRHPRGSLACSSYPFRALFFQNSCKACRLDDPAQLFQLMSGPTNVGYICRRCVTNDEYVKAFMLDRLYSVSTVSLRGKKLKW